MHIQGFSQHVAGSRQANTNPAEVRKQAPSRSAEKRREEHQRAKKKRTSEVKDLNDKIEVLERELVRAKSEVEKAERTASKFAREHMNCGTRATQRQCALKSAHVGFTLLPSWCKVSSVIANYPSDSEFVEGTDTDWVSKLHAWMDNHDRLWEGPLVSVSTCFPELTLSLLPRDSSPVGTSTPSEHKVRSSFPTFAKPPMGSSRPSSRSLTRLWGSSRPLVAWSEETTYIS